VVLGIVIVIVVEIGRVTAGARASETLSTKCVVTAFAKMPQY